MISCFSPAFLVIFCNVFFFPKSFPSSFSPPFPFQSLKSAQLKESSRERKGEGGERRRRREKASEKFTCSEGATIREKKRNFEIAPPPLRWSYTQEKELPLPPPLKKKKRERETGGRNFWATNSVTGSAEASKFAKLNFALLSRADSLSLGEEHYLECAYVKASTS